MLRWGVRYIEDNKKKWRRDKLKKLDEREELEIRVVEEIQRGEDRTLLEEKKETGLEEPKENKK